MATEECLFTAPNTTRMNCAKFTSSKTISAQIHDQCAPPRSAIEAIYVTDALPNDAHKLCWHTVQQMCTRPPFQFLRLAGRMCMIWKIILKSRQKRTSRTPRSSREPLAFVCKRYDYQICLPLDLMGQRLSEGNGAKVFLGWHNKPGPPERPLGRNKQGAACINAWLLDSVMRSIIYENICF